MKQKIGPKALRRKNGQVTLKETADGEGMEKV